MNIYSKLVIAALAVTGVAMVTPSAEAQSLNESVTVTFSAPVELPGRILPAGTYVFAEVEPNVTRIQSAGGNTVYGTYLTVPEERRETLDKGSIVLGENTTDSPERVEAWFYPGDTVGNEFMYPAHNSHNKLTSVVDKAGKETDVAVIDTAKATLVSSEFVGRHAEHVIVNSGAAVGHAVKYLVS